MLTSRYQNAGYNLDTRNGSENVAKVKYEVAKSYNTLKIASMLKSNAD
jgi:hypothetical protein